ncbi:hypothetical protein EV06_0213 [Prochlorococcus sp. MIT 0602]|nr:hypothetical protein EV06_0213 [Prochlorococcus sp. MIT 0602]
MAPSANLAISVLKEIESHFGWPPMKVASKPNGNGPVFLKANQHTGDIHVRIEYGLGEGVLIGCQFHSEEKSSATIGPLPLNFFKVKNHEEANPLMSNKPE